MIRAAALLAAAALLPGASSDPLEGYAPAGPPVRCLSDNDLSPVILDEHTIGLHRTGKRWWVSRIEECPARLEQLSTLIIERYGGSLCANDRFRVLEPGLSIPSAYCRFNDFTPYDKVATKR